MAVDRSIDRRRFLTRAAAATGMLLLGGCDRLSGTQPVRRAMYGAEELSLFFQRLLLGRGALAREYAEEDISPWFKPNGSTDPQGDAYRAASANNFAEWQLQVNGLVERPQELSLSNLRAMPSRTQITRHDCVEGWSCIGKWTGVRLGALLDEAGLKPQARYIVFHCADTLGGLSARPYYESVDLVDAYHPQTILAYDMNGQALPVRHGAPLRLRLERQLGYKMAKYVMRVEAVDSLADIGEGRGGYWEDQGYAWYAGI